MNAGAEHLLIRHAVCPGDWVLLTALHRTEAGALFALAGRPYNLTSETTPWEIRVVQAHTQKACSIQTESENKLPSHMLVKLKQGLSFRYAHLAATAAPSKQTATQRKGRIKDAEAAEDTQTPKQFHRQWRKPGFAKGHAGGKEYGNAIHAAMQYLDYNACTDETSVKAELERLVAERYISPEQGRLVPAEKLSRFFASALGQKIRQGNVVREFKFSILEDGEAYDPSLAGEKVLLQGVVDCALIEDDGITVLDFKTDYVTEETWPAVVEKYRPQVAAYAHAMERIYQKPIKQALLYFFHMDRFAEVDV